MVDPEEVAYFSFPELLDHSQGEVGIAQGDYTKRLHRLLDTLDARPDLRSAVKRLALSTQESYHASWSTAPPFPVIELGPAQQLLEWTAVDRLRLIDLDGGNAKAWVAMVARSAPNVKQLEINAANGRADIERVQFNSFAESLATLSKVEHLKLDSVCFEDASDSSRGIAFPRNTTPTFKLKSLDIDDRMDPGPAPIEVLSWLCGASARSPSTLSRLSLSLADLALLEWIKSNLPALTHCTLPLQSQGGHQITDEYFTKLLEFARLPGVVELKLLYAGGAVKEEELSAYRQHTDALNSKIGRQVIEFTLQEP